MDIEVIQNAGVMNVETRISDLRLDDAERVASAIHEIRIAAAFIAEGRRVLFIPEDEVVRLTCSSMTASKSSANISAESAAGIGSDMNYTESCLDALICIP